MHFKGMLLNESFAICRNRAALGALAYDKGRKMGFVIHAVGAPKQTFGKRDS